MFANLFNRFTISCATVLILAGFLILVGTDMAKSDEYVCSPMTAQLRHANGEPATGISVRREWFWRGKSGVHNTTTDGEGRFSFPAVAPRRGLFGFLPAEEAVRQIFTASLSSGEFEFLDIHTSGLALNAETQGRVFDLICKVGVEPGKADVGWGTCSFVR